MSKEFPRYKCHKEVRAAKIDIVEHLEESGDTILHFAEQRPIKVSDAWFAKHVPIAGGYFIIYKDGYTSFSPAVAFEDGYTLIEE